MLYNWDAVQFALALREFDVAKHQPHPPGYLLYVGLGRLLNMPAGRSRPGLRRARHGLQRRHHRDRLLAGARALRPRHRRRRRRALLAVSPLFWFYGSVGLTYAGEAFGASLVALLAYRRAPRQRHPSLRGRRGLGLAGGHPPVRARAALPALRRLRRAWVSAARARLARRRRPHGGRGAPGSCPWSG